MHLPHWRQCFSVTTKAWFRESTRVVPDQGTTSSCSCLDQRQLDVVMKGIVFHGTKYAPTCYDSQFQLKQAVLTLSTQFCSFHDNNHHWVRTSKHQWHVQYGTGCATYTGCEMNFERMSC